MPGARTCASSSRPITPRSATTTTAPDAGSRLRLDYAVQADRERHRPRGAERASVRRPRSVSGAQLRQSVPRTRAARARRARRPRPAGIRSATRSCSDSGFPPDRVSRLCGDRSRSIDGYLTRIVEKPGREYYDAAGPHALISMNVWRFDDRIFDACRDVPLSARGEYELPEAVGLAVSRGVRFRDVPAAGAVLDLSRRATWRWSASASRAWSRGHDTTIAQHFESLGMTAADAASRAALFAQLEHASRADPRRRARVAPLHAGPHRDLRQAHRLRRRPFAARRGAARHHARRAPPRRRHRPRRRHLRRPGDRSRSGRRGAGALSRPATLRARRRAPASSSIFPAAISAPTSRSPAICRAHPD